MTKFLSQLAITVSLLLTQQVDQSRLPSYYAPWSHTQTFSCLICQFMSSEVNRKSITEAPTPHQVFRHILKKLLGSRLLQLSLIQCFFNVGAIESTIQYI